MFCNILRQKVLKKESLRFKPTLDGPTNVIPGLSRPKLILEHIIRKSTNVVVGLSSQKAKSWVFTLIEYNGDVGHHSPPPLLCWHGHAEINGQQRQKHLDKRIINLLYMIQ
jgi:hypothetical protein